MLLLAALLAGCAGFSGTGLKPGVATEAEVEKAMGPSAERRQVAGETVLFYSRLPAGREMYAARFGADGRLIAIEQRLTRENAQTLVAKQSTKEDVRNLFGPPFRVNDYPRLTRQVWLYPMHEGAVRFTLNVDFTADGRVYEVKLYDEPDVDN